MSKKIIYLESPCCSTKFLRSVMYGGKYDPEKDMECPNCRSHSMLMEWNWYEKMKITYMRELENCEVSKLIV